MKKYRLVGVLPEGKLRFKGKDYDLTTLDDKKAEFLFNNKVSFIEKVGTSEKVEKPETIKKDSKKETDNLNS